MGLEFPRILFYVTTILHIKKSFLRWNLLPGSFLSQNLSGKTTTPKQERKLPVRQEITVKSTPKKTQKTSLSITSPLALP